MTVGDCFAGLGGFLDGFRIAGFEVAWQIEIEDKLRSRLERLYPDARQFGDIQRVRRPGFVDVMCGGFPCQDNSTARTSGERLGLDGEKSGLWTEFARLVGEVRPRYVVVENVAGLLQSGRGFGRVLGDLATFGYDAEWDVLEAAAFGAPHKRARVWLVAYSHGNRQSDGPIDDEASVLPRTDPPIREWPDPPCDLRMDDGVSDWRDRTRALGNGILPQIAEYIAGCVKRHSNQCTER